ncbi:MAG: hypothetical protein HZB51_34395 [Chloroflexi bacterium]|nr:hypothetical protein [Chloroflexota bacterium]
MKPNTLQLGFEVGTGKPVHIPLKHMAVVGQSQEAGKTTTLEALISRLELRAIAFITKRGEGAFRNAQSILPYFRERTDWVFVSSLIDATLREKNKILRPWLMNVCRNTRTLAEVRKNVIIAKAEARGFAESILTEIEGYLDLVIPQLKQLPPSTSIHLAEGLNVMDISPYSTELQALVIRSVIEFVYEKLDHTITIIPEAWEFMPEGRGSPVKVAAEELIRKGAGLKNFVWYDTQDLAGIDKLALRAAPVLLIGVQREANEIKRTLANIPAGIARPKASDIASLAKGQFYACFGNNVIRTYVQPAWLDAETARRVALGTIDVEDLDQKRATARAKHIPMRQTVVSVSPLVIESKPLDVQDQRKRQLMDEIKQLEKRLAELQQEIAVLEKRKALLERPVQPAREECSAELKQAMPAPMTFPLTDAMLEQIYTYVVERATADPKAITLTKTTPQIEVTVHYETITMNNRTLDGRMAQMIAEGFFDTPRIGQNVYDELWVKRQFTPAKVKVNIYNTLDNLTRLGFLITDNGKTFMAVPGMKVRIVEES